MYLEVFGSVVHLVVDNNINVFFSVVLLDLLHVVCVEKDSLLGGSSNRALINTHIMIACIWS